jgi:hypothetical protein
MGKGIIGIGLALDYCLVQALISIMPSPLGFTLHLRSKHNIPHLFSSMGI